MPPVGWPVASLNSPDNCDTEGVPIYAKEHFLLSALVGGALAPLVETRLPTAILVVYAAVLGVAIDADHFVVSRLETGDWRALASLRREFTNTLFGMETIFDTDEVQPHQRLLSHHLAGGAVVGGVWVVSPPLALVSTVVLYAHVLGDLYADTFREDGYFDGAAEASSAETESRW